MVFGFREGGCCDGEAFWQCTGSVVQTMDLNARLFCSERVRECQDGRCATGQKKTPAWLWEEHLKAPLAALAKALECLENPYWGWHLVSQLVAASRRNGFQHRWCKDFAKDVGRGPVGKASLDPWTLCVLRTSSRVWNVLGKFGPHGEVFFFLIQKGPFALKPCVPAETLKACALSGLHLMAAGGESGSSSSSGVSSPELVRGTLCGKKTLLAPEMRAQWVMRCFEHNHECLAVEVIRQA